MRKLDAASRLGEAMARVGKNSRSAEISILMFVLATMEGIKDDPEREKFCVDFDNNFEQRKAMYKALSGKEWAE